MKLDTARQVAPPLKLEDLDLGGCCQGCRPSVPAGLKLKSLLRIEEPEIELFSLWGFSHAQALADLWAEQTNCSAPGPFPEDTFTADLKERRALQAVGEGLFDDQELANCTPVVEQWTRSGGDFEVSKLARDGTCVCARDRSGTHVGPPFDRRCAA